MGRGYNISLPIFFYRKVIFMIRIITVYGPMLLIALGRTLLLALLGLFFACIIGMIFGIMGVLKNRALYRHSRLRPHKVAALGWCRPCRLRQGVHPAGRRAAAGKGIFPEALAQRDGNRLEAAPLSARAS